MDTRDRPEAQQEMARLFEATADAAVRHGALDILFVAGLPPLLAFATEVMPLPQEPLSADDVGALIRVLIEFKVGRLLTFDPSRAGEAEFVADIPGVARYRVAIFRQRGTPAAVLRPVWRSLPPLEALGVPEQITAFLRRRRGLLLVAGPSAAGKSTTLSALVEYINQNMTRHIISIENPVEYTHKRVHSIISQRSIPEDTPSYSRAVRAALRQLPDVLVVGDVQDTATAAAALGAAESGHLVIAAVHSKDASDAVLRLEGFFPPEQRKQVAVQVANTVLAILVQQLLSRRGANGRVLATEFLIATAGIRHLIRTGQTFRLNTFLQSGRHLGMHTMEDSLAEFARSGIVDYGEALTATADVGLFLNLFRKRLWEHDSQGTGRVVMTRRTSQVKPGAGTYGLDVSPELNMYRTDLLATSLDLWSSNGLLRLEDGAICFRADPFQPTLYAQITDYSIWLGQRSPFGLANFARAIVRGRLEGGETRDPSARGAGPRCQVWILVVLRDNSVVTLPGHDEPGVDLPLDDLWHTLHFPVPPDLVGEEVRAYALRFSRAQVEVRVREVLFA